MLPLKGLVLPLNLYTLAMCIWFAGLAMVVVLLKLILLNVKSADGVKIILSAKKGVPDLTTRSVAEATVNICDRII